jgi:Spy/CpxP family protein refolding chaperone
MSALAVAAIFIAACDNAATAPKADESALLVFDQAASMDSASGVPRGPFMDRELPDSIKLTDAQKAAIKALHDAYAAAHKAQFDQLKAIHDEARAAMKAGKTRDEVKAILDKGKVIMDGMKADFDALQAKVQAILTPAQKAWFAAHQRHEGGPMGGMMPGRKP